MAGRCFGDAGQFGDADEQVSRTRSGVPVFTIHAEGRIPGDIVYAREAMVDFTGGENLPFVIRAWRQAERTLFPIDEMADTVVR